MRKWIQEEKWNYSRQLNGIPKNIRAELLPIAIEDSA
jgi:hypothetical protein